MAIAGNGLRLIAPFMGDEKVWGTLSKVCVGWRESIAKLFQEEINFIRAEVGIRTFNLYYFKATAHKGTHRRHPLELLSLLFKRQATDMEKLRIGYPPANLTDPEARFRYIDNAQLIATYNIGYVAAKLPPRAIKASKGVLVSPSKYNSENQKERGAKRIKGMRYELRNVTTLDLDDLPVTRLEPVLARHLMGVKTLSVSNSSLMDVPGEMTGLSTVIGLKSNRGVMNPALNAEFADDSFYEYDPKRPTPKLLQFSPISDGSSSEAETVGFSD